MSFESLSNRPLDTKSSFTSILPFTNLLAPLKHLKLRLPHAPASTVENVRATFVSVHQKLDDDSLFHIFVVHVQNTIATLTITPVWLENTTD